MEWKISDNLMPYDEAVREMEARVAAIYAGGADECIWLLQHPPLYTAGSSADPADLLNAKDFPVYSPGRGGEYTYHGPGQRIAYVMLDLKKRFSPSPPDLRSYIHRLENWIIAALAEFGLEAFTREDRIGVWVNEGSRDDGVNSEAKIAAIGVRVRRWVSYHGVAINVHPDLNHYKGIVPCGIRDFGVTSLKQLGYDVTLPELDKALKKHANYLS